MSGADQEILLCVVTRLEIGKVMNIAQELDDAAFITVHPLAEVKGGRSRSPRTISTRPGRRVLGAGDASRAC